jgi:hypothetical protein
MHSARGPVKASIGPPGRVKRSRPMTDRFIRKGAEKSTISLSDRRELALAEGERKTGYDP